MAAVTSNASSVALAMAAANATNSHLPSSYPPTIKSPDSQVSDSKSNADERDGPSPPRDSATPVVHASASVGHDHWANDVMSAVSEPVAAPSTSSESEADDLAGKILEKKRKFHSGRALELKNLPDGCTEQVGCWQKLTQEIV